MRGPWHLWVVGIVALLWNSLGTFDYLMTQTQNPKYMASFTPEQLDYFYGFPAWMVAFWAIAVWGGLLGCLLLLFRKKLAVLVFLVSFLALIVTIIYNYGLSNGLEIMGTLGVVMTVLIFVIAFLLLLYARAMKRREVLA